MRPFLAARMTLAIDRPTVGRYDEERGMSVDDRGHPLALAAGSGETMTKTRGPDPADPEAGWLLETQTDARLEEPDDFRIPAETLTRVRREDPDPATLITVLPPTDDSATGVVAF
jgi:hypothetical protein